MNVEEIRDFCLSLGTDVEEKLPFAKFKNGENVLVFYVCGHMFCFFDLNDFQVISLKCQPVRIDELKAEYDCVGNPYNESLGAGSVVTHDIPDDVVVAGNPAKVIKTIK